MIRTLSFFVASCMVFMPMQVSGQQAQPASQTDELVVVPKSSLTAQQLAEVNAKKLTENLEHYNKWAQMGKAIGIGVKETLTAVTEETSKFAQTDVGKVAVFLVAWKIMADDVPGLVSMAVGYLVGIPLFFFGSIVLVWSYRRMCMPRRVLIETDGKVKKYQMYDPEPTLNKDWGKEGWMMAHAVMFIILTAISCMMIFA